MSMPSHACNIPRRESEVHQSDFSGHLRRVVGVGEFSGDVEPGEGRRRRRREVRRLTNERDQEEGGYMWRGKSSEKSRGRKSEGGMEKRGE
jgi:hypothetical protein